MSAFKLLCFVFLQNAMYLVIAVEPTLQWSMETHDETIIYPDGIKSEMWKGDLSPLAEGDYFVPGVRGNALNAQNAVSLSQTLYNDCIYDVETCIGNELTISFWIKITKWTPSNTNGILRTTTYKVDNPGVFIGDNESKNEIKFIVFKSSGHRYISSIPLPNLNEWVNIKMMWSEMGIDVFINDKALEKMEYLVHSEHSVENPSELIGSKLEVGSNVETSFYLDDLKVFGNSSVASTSTCPDCSCVDENPEDEFTLSELEIILMAIVAAVAVVVLAVALALLCLKQSKTRSSELNRIYHARERSRQNKAPFAEDDRESDFN